MENLRERVARLSIASEAEREYATSGHSGKRYSKNTLQGASHGFSQNETTPTSTFSGVSWKQIQSSDEEQEYETYDQDTFFEGSNYGSSDESAHDEVDAYATDLEESETDRPSYFVDVDDISKFPSGVDIPSYSNPAFRQQCRLNRKSQSWSRKECRINRPKEEQKLRKLIADDSKLDYEIPANEYFLLENARVDGERMLRTGTKLLDESRKLLLEKPKPRTISTEEIVERKLLFRPLESSELKNPPEEIYRYEERKKHLLKFRFDPAHVENFLLEKHLDTKRDERVKPVPRPTKAANVKINEKKTDLTLDPSDLKRGESPDRARTPKVTFVSGPIEIKSGPNKQERNINPGLMIPRKKYLSDQGKERLKMQIAERNLLRAQIIQRRAATKAAKKQQRAENMSAKVRVSENVTHLPVFRPRMKSAGGSELDSAFYQRWDKIPIGTTNPSEPLKKLFASEVREMRKLSGKGIIPATPGESYIQNIRESQLSRIYVPPHY